MLALAIHILEHRIDKSRLRLQPGRCDQFLDRRRCALALHDALRQGQTAGAVIHQQDLAILLDQGRHDQIGAMRKGMRGGRRRDISAARIAKARLGGAAEGLDTANQDDVIARLDGLVHTAIKPAAGPVQNRRTVRTIVPVDGGKAVLDRAGEGVGDIDLRFGQNVDRKAICTDQRVIIARGIGQTDQDQRRVQ